MKYSTDIHALDSFEIVSNQQVCVSRIPEFLLPSVLKLNLINPLDRKKLIEEQMKKLELQNSITKAFGITVSEKMLDGNLEQLTPVKIICKNNMELEYNEISGFFKINCKDYFKRGNIKKIIILSTQEDHFKAMKCVERLVKLISPNDHIFPFPIQSKFFNTYSRNLNEWVEALAPYKNLGYFVIVVDGVAESHEFLKFAEARTGVVTQHLKSETAENVPKRYQTSQNIVHKLNVKTGGLNYIVKFSENVPNLNINSGKVFIIGMDVCHPTGNNFKSATVVPSTVGVVSNYLKDPNDFVPSFFYQEPRKESVNEDYLARYVKEALNHRNQFHQTKFIVLLRDGVSEGQYSMVKDKEIGAIKSVVNELGLNDIKIICFIITKRITTRHFITSPDNSVVEGLPPRSFIFFGYRFGFKQFYMIPHKSCIGTAKTIMVTVIHEDFTISKAEAQEFLLGMTQLHQIVTCPISIPTPVYQADAIAERGASLFQTMQKYHPNDIPQCRIDGEEESIDYEELTKILSFYHGTHLPQTRHNA